MAGQLSNRSLVLEAIRTHAPTSRIELAHLTGLTAASITNIVRVLLRDGLVAEVGHSESTGGKRRVLLDINHEARYALGVQFGGGAIAVAISNLWGAVVGRSRSRSGSALDPHASVVRMASAANGLVDSLGIDRSALVGAGVAAPGPLDQARGALGPARNLPGWHGFPLREEFARAAGIPTSIHHDATAAAAGEAWSGAARASESLAMVYMDVGIGAGLILNGLPVGGSSGNAGEFGHTVVTQGGPMCRCGGRGCLEAVAGPHAVESAYEALTGRRQNFAKIGAAALAEEPEALSLLRQSAGAMSTAVLSLANVLDLDQVILAGPGFGDVASLYVESVAARLNSEFASRSSHGVQVGISLNMRDAAAVGASVLALRAHLA
ncbi:ROK family transcriptional regulator [Tessaracoccus lubricantis]|uniref:ROK family transcriptional regulator n=1 Tax=Tessaracoccus lubricantis TaxID=545543 RepID=A0ABP9EZR3_9ACTN